MDGSARDAFGWSGPSRKDDVPMRPFVQSRKMVLPDPVIFTQKAGDDALGGLALGIASIHPNHRAYGLYLPIDRNRFNQGFKENVSGFCNKIPCAF